MKVFISYAKEDVSEALWISHVLNDEPDIDAWIAHIHKDDHILFAQIEAGHNARRQLEFIKLIGIALKSSFGPAS